MPRYSYYLFKSQYDPDLKIPGIQTGPMIYICHELTYISESDVVVYTNCQQARLTWLGKQYGPQGPDTSAHEPHPPIVFKNVFDIHPIGGALNHNNPEAASADGRGGADQWAGGLPRGEAIPGANGGPSPGNRRPGRAAPGRRVPTSFRSVPAVVDNFGTIKVLESAYVHFQVDGPGSIIGGEANQANPMKTQFGVATALVRAGLTPGTLHVTATCDGLKPASIDITTVAPRLPLFPPPSP